MNSNTKFQFQSSLVLFDIVFCTVPMIQHLFYKIEKVSLKVVLVTLTILYFVEKPHMFVMQGSYFGNDLQVGTIKQGQHNFKQFELNIIQYDDHVVTIDANDRLYTLVTHPLHWLFRSESDGKHIILQEERSIFNEVYRMVFNFLLFNLWFAYKPLLANWSVRHGIRSGKNNELTQSFKRSWN